MENMTEYLLFIHGINTRETRDQPDFADPLIQNVQHLCSPGMPIKPIALHWGDVNAGAEQSVLKAFQESPAWEKLCFPNLRSKQLLQFAGDLALFISRASGKLLVDRLVQEVMSSSLHDFHPHEDHLHLITHGVGTMILFDLLFSSRWDAANVGGYDGVEHLRHQIFQGQFPIRSIHTMGSPFGMFRLIKGDSAPLPNTHDITPRLRDYLQQLHEETGTPLLWRNYLHPLDPVATPIEQLVPEMLNMDRACFDVKDLLTQEPDLISQISELTIQALGGRGEKGEKMEIAQLLLLSGSAHTSYWSNPLVASTIIQTVQIASRQLQPAW
jgi:hypothetical protein